MNDYFDVIEGEVKEGGKHIYPKKPYIETPIEVAPTAEETTEDTSAAEDTPIGTEDAPIAAEKIRDADENQPEEEEK